MRLVGGMTVCLYVFPALLAEVRRVHPHLDLKVTVGSAERSIAMLRSGAGDLGLITLPVEATDLVSVPVLEEELLLITYPAHPLAKKKSITPADLDKQQFVLFETGSITRRLVGVVLRARERSSPRSSWRPRTWRSSRRWSATASASASSRGRRRPPTSARGQLFCSRIAGHSLVRQTGWLYPKMSRLPRTVSEVIRIFETVRPRLESADAEEVGGRR